MLNFLTIALSTFFYLGYLPLIPGTFGSIAAIALFYLTKGSVVLHIYLTAAILILGFLVAGRAERLFNRKDSRHIVIDEVGGMLLSLLFIPYDIRLVVLAFILFRILDSLKPYPTNCLQKLKGSLGIMSDDIIAGLYANIVLQAVWRLTSFSLS